MSGEERKAKPLGLTETEFAFYGILMAEVSREKVELIDGETHQSILSLVKELTKLLEDAAGIVRFFEKHNEQKRVKAEIRRAIYKQSFSSDTLVDAVSARFMELAKVKFR